MRYNRSHIKTRNGIERLFGQWQRRFWCLFYLRLRLNCIFPVIIATAILHNLCKLRNVPLITDSPDYGNTDSSMNSCVNTGIDTNYSNLSEAQMRSGFTIRKSMIERNFN